MEIGVALLIKENHEKALSWFLSRQGVFGIPLSPDGIFRTHFLDCYSKEFPMPGEKLGYKNAMFSQGITHIQKSITALEAALYWYCECATEVDFVWLFEEDCFIPSQDAITNLIKKYTIDGVNDLVISSHKEKTNKIPDWHWGNIFKIIGPPYFHSMACAVGLSRKMLNVIRDYAREHKTLFYHEIMFNTLAAHNNLTVCCAEELRTVVWKGDWCLDDVLQRPLNIFHPMKNLDNQIRLREMIVHAKEIGYEPADKLPNFVKYSPEEL